MSLAALSAVAPVVSVGPVGGATTGSSTPAGGESGRPTGEFARALDQAGAVRQARPAQVADASDQAGTSSASEARGGDEGIDDADTSASSDDPGEDADAPAAAGAAGSAIGDGAALLLAELRALRMPRGAAPADAEAASGADAAQSGASTKSTVRPGREPELLAAAQRLSDRQAVVPMQALAEAVVQAAADEPIAGRTEAGGSAFALPLPAPPAGTAAGSGAGVAEGRLAATPGSAGFASQLGAQLTTFVRDGVQHARLHLNPAEMGPVTVRIQLDGAAAHVQLLAEHALTRQALEQSMPLLAGSLREAGLTLGGGGVFEQPRQPGDGAPGATAGAAGAGRHDDDHADATVRPASLVQRRRGVVDLVA